MTDYIDETHDMFELVSIDATYSANELCQLCRVDEAELLIYIEHGIIAAESIDNRLFKHSQLDRLQRAMRLQSDLEVNHAGAALALDLLESIARLERDLALLKR